MKRKSISLAAGPRNVLILFVILVFPTRLLSQNSAVRWSSFDMGFALSVSSNTMVKSAIGQGFVGTIQQGNTRIENGFFADTSFRGTITSANEVPSVPWTYSLRQNYPNPFNPSTTIQYGLLMHSNVHLIVYNILGQVVKELVNTEQQAGIQSVIWNATVSSGIYFYRLEATSKDDPSKRFVETKKMLLLR